MVYVGLSEAENSFSLGKRYFSKMTAMASAMWQRRLNSVCKYNLHGPLHQRQSHPIRPTLIPASILTLGELLPISIVFTRVKRAIASYYSLLNTNQPISSPSAPCRISEIGFNGDHRSSRHSTPYSH